MDDIEDHLNYFDEQAVQCRFVEMPDSTPDQVWFAHFMASGDPTLEDRDGLVRELETALNAPGQHLDYALRIERGYYQWGASGATQEIVVQVTNYLLQEGLSAASDTAKLAAGYGLKVLWDKWRARQGAGAEEDILQGRDIAEAMARSKVSRGFDVSESQLTLVSESRRPDDNEWVFEFQHGQVAFSITMRTHAGELLTGEIHRAIGDDRIVDPELDAPEEAQP